MLLDFLFLRSLPLSPLTNSYCKYEDKSMTQKNVKRKFIVPVMFFCLVILFSIGNNVQAHASGMYKYYSIRQVGRNSLLPEHAYYIYSMKGNKVYYKKTHWVCDQYSISMFAYGPMRSAKITKATRFFVGDYQKYYSKTANLGGLSSSKALNIRWLKKAKRTDFINGKEYGRKCVYYKRNNLISTKEWHGYKPVSTCYDFLKIRNGKVQDLALCLQISG